MSIDTSTLTGDVQAAVTLLQQYQQAINEVEKNKKLDIDTTDAQKKADKLLGQIAGLSDNTKKAIGIDVKLDEKGIAKVMYTGWILYAAMFALAAFLSTYALQSGISAFVAAFPQWLVHGFEVAGGLMPAVGLALLLVVMLKKENAAYLLAGFVIMVITNCQNILPIAVIAGCIAYVNFTRDMETAKLTAASAATAAQEGDFEDGI